MEGAKATVLLCTGYCAMKALAQVEESPHTQKSNSEWVSVLKKKKQQIDEHDIVLVSWCPVKIYMMLS